jgi:MoCo/4Fe-4S cofactor protein with predicted Tat translocation signal
MSKQTPPIWSSVEQLNNDPEFLASVQQEFQPLSVENLAEEGENGGLLQGNRRDFLKMLGFSLGAATIAACDIPVRKAIPYSIRPDEIVPGVANYYASSLALGGDYCSVLVKTREGRPIKIEGNGLSPITKGGTSARAQATVLSLYDTNRLRQPGKVADGKVTATTWADLDKEIKAALTASSNIRVVMHTQMSPSLDAALAEFASKYEGKVKFVVYDPISSSALLDACNDAMGMRALPDFRFDKAKTIVGIDCDFLGSWVSPVEFAADYAKRRRAVKMKDVAKEMSRHIQFEAHMSLTGSNADNRVLVKPSEMGLAVAKLYNAVAEKIGAPSVSAPSGSFSWAKADAAIKKAAEALVATNGESLVVCGTNDKSIQTLVMGINAMLGSFGSTILSARLSHQRQGNDASVKALLDEMGGVDAIFFYHCNPAFDLPGLAAEFRQKLAGVKLSVSLNGSLDETSKLCKFVAPDHHILESWGDVEPKSGHYSLVQPTIRPLFETRQAGQSFLAWGESANLDMLSEQPFYEYVKKQWETKVYAKSGGGFATFTGFWDQCVHDGVFSVDTASVSVSAPSAEALSAAASALKSPGTSGLEVVFYETVNIGNGSYANNPWLQEMPDPVQRTTWGNYLAIPVRYDQGVNNFDAFLGDLHKLQDGDLVKLTIGGVEAEFAVYRQFGMHKDTIAVGLGYGRDAAGPAGNRVGVDVYPMAKFQGGYFSYSNAEVAVGGKTGKEDWFSSVQMHHTYGIQTDASKATDEPNVDETVLGHHGFQGSLTKRSVLFAATVADLKEKQEDLAEFRHEAQHLNEKGLYPEYSEYQRSHFWGMSIDLSACIGCGACQVACVAENNVPVVGKREVARSHEMTWLRIDRYFYGNEETPNTAYMPMMCQHCQNAPCENVCPVNATNHSFEGLNQMAYNRCIGTRYCANNCPFKVRRFNWLDYTSADLFWSNEHNLNSDNSDKETLTYMTDNLTRMVLNPDVTVRSRGVIEKCSLCVQRIQAGKLTAKVESRKLEDGDVKTACQTACPTGAIVFGDRNDPNSELMAQWETPLNYHALEEVNVRPTVSYLMKVTNGEDSFYQS